MLKPNVKPKMPNFSSGPCAKRPQWNTDILKKSLLGRSHRARVSKEKLNQVIQLTKKILQIPNDFLVGIVPGSDTGAVELLLWNCLGLRGSHIFVWDSFGNDWALDLKNQLSLNNLTVTKADYGNLPNFSKLSLEDDVIFNWNGTTSGVCVKNVDWISLDRKGITVCDATSAAFAMNLDWKKLDCTTFSWQKCLGGEAGQGMIILSPKAIDRINSYTPNWPIPKLFQIKKNGKLNLDIFNGSTINTPSMLCVEDFYDSLIWAQEIGGLSELIQRSTSNLKIFQDWLKNSTWLEFLSKDISNISSTSICFKFSGTNLTDKDTSYFNKLEKYIIEYLEYEKVAFDIGSYRSAPPGLRIWGGPTIEKDDLIKLLPWLDYAYYQALKKI